MKKIAFISVLLLFVFTSNAAESTFLKGNINCNLGVNSINKYYNRFCASADYCLADSIFKKCSVGIGISTGYSNGYSYDALYGGLRGTFHCSVISKLDTYGGFGIEKIYVLGEGLQSYPNMCFFLGANYSFTKRLALFCEFGVGEPDFSVGITLKL